MSAPAKPATPLPYEAHVNPDKRTAEILSKAGTVVGTVSADCSEYIVHACNSYPRLVEALQLAVKYYVGTGRTSETVAGESGKAADKIHALLRELGEER